MSKISGKRESNKINLQLGVTGLERFYYLLQVVASAGVVNAKDAATKLIPEARARIGNWSKSSNDWHSALSFGYMGLIEYKKDKRFSISELGREFLAAFDMSLVKNGRRLKPVLKDKLSPGERCALMRRIFEETRIVQEKFGRDIHPYKMLFRFLSEEGLSGYITNQEWEDFVESPSSLRDEQYSDYVSRIQALRGGRESSSKVFKRVDRILTMLVDWGVLRKSGSGHSTRFCFTEGFVGNVSSIETSGKVFVDEHSIELKFIEWLMKQPSNKGTGLITEKAAVNYAAKLRICVNKPPFLSIGCENVFQTVDIDEFVRLKAEIEAVKGFKVFDKAKANGNGYFSKALAYYEEFLKMHPGFVLVKICQQVCKELDLTGLRYDLRLIRRFVSALLAKPFVVLTGLSGSGKTKLAESFTRWLCGYQKRIDAKTGNEFGVDNVKLVSVGADWTNSEKLLGYPDALHGGQYVMPDTGILQFLLKACDDEKNGVPYFLILDEMNLSHVERYFADFLSAMESADRIVRLHDSDEIVTKSSVKIPKTIMIPRNLFVIGTMNVDETTYMFSPKVLDRAQVIEFRVEEKEMLNYLEGSSDIDLDKLCDGDGKGLGVAYAASFIAASKKNYVQVDAAKDALGQFFPILAKLGAEFGFRTASEFRRFAAIYVAAGGEPEDAVDFAIMQKLLPKLHGSRRKLEKRLKKLWNLCLKDYDQNASEEKDEELPSADIEVDYVGKCRYPVSAEKIVRMARSAQEVGFASFAEA